MAERYAAGSAWARANPEEEYRHAALRTARNGLAASIRDFHARGLELQKEHGGVPDDLRRSIALYEQYLGRFPDGEKSYEARFRYAQALFAVGDYMKAAEAFRIVASDEQFDANREAAAYSRILSVTKIAGEGDHVPPALVEPLVTAYEDYVARNRTATRARRSSSRKATRTFARIRTLRRSVRSTDSFAPIPSIASPARPMIRSRALSSVSPTFRRPSDRARRHSRRPARGGHSRRAGQRSRIFPRSRSSSRARRPKRRRASRRPRGII